MSGLGSAIAWLTWNKTVHLSSLSLLIHTMGPTPPTLPMGQAVVMVKRHHTSGTVLAISTVLVKNPPAYKGVGLARTDLTSE